MITQAPQTYDERLAAVVNTDHATSRDLQRALEQLRTEIQLRQEVELRLRTEIQDRERAEQQLRSNLELIQTQEQTLSDLSSPILQIWKGVVAVPIVGRVEDHRIVQLRENLLTRIRELQARFVILDLTGAETPEGSTVSNILSIVQAARLLGAQSLLSGISPDMASLLVNEASDFRHVRAHATLEDALRYALQHLERRSSAKKLA